MKLNLIFRFGILTLILFSFAFNAKNILPKNAQNQNVNATISESNTISEETENCEFDGIKLYGKVQFVDNFPDLKIQYVEHFPDINVKFVENFPNDCGEWQVVENFPDFKVQVVEHFPDLKVKQVENFPGME